MTAILGDAILYWGAAVAISLAAAAWQADRHGLDTWTMYLAGLLGFGGALLLGDGFALLVSSGHMYEVPPGRGVVGALLGAALGAWGILQMRGAHFLSYADAAAPAAALGYAIYRIGCFLNGCCFGTETDLPWAVTLGVNSEAFAAQVAAGLTAPDASHTLQVHPTQFYHALLGIAAFFLLPRIKANVPGRRFAAALILYGAGRFWIEFFRGDAIPVLGPLDVNHIAALVMLVAGMWLWRFRVAFISVAGSKPSV